MRFLGSQARIIHKGLDEDRRPANSTNYSPKNTQKRRLLCSSSLGKDKEREHKMAHARDPLHSGIYSLMPQHIYTDSTRKHSLRFLILSLLSSHCTAAKSAPEILLFGAFTQILSITRLHEHPTGFYVLRVRATRCDLAGNALVCAAAERPSLSLDL
jgi:hypothetical protein